MEWYPNSPTVRLATKPRIIPTLTATPAAQIARSSCTHRRHAMPSVNGTEMMKRVPMRGASARYSGTRIRCTSPARATKTAPAFAIVLDRVTL